MANYYLTESPSLNISRGLVKGARPVHVLGYNPDIDTGSDPETVWSYGGLYPWATLVSANNLSIVSSNTADVASVTIIGLDDNYEELTETITLTGTSDVTTVNKFLRINDAYYNGTSSNQGNVLFKWANSSGTVVDEIYASRGQNTTGIYTIPKGKTGYLYVGDTSVGLNKEVTVVFKVRYFGQSFRVSHIVELCSETYRYEFPFPPPLPEKTDLEVLVENTLDNNTRVACNFDILLVDTPIR